MNRWADTVLSRVIKISTGDLSIKLDAHCVLFIDPGKA